jgi:hypothetical protein
MPLGGWRGVKGPRSNNMPRAPRNVNPALVLSQKTFIFWCLIWQHFWHSLTGASTVKTSKREDCFKSIFLLIWWLHICEGPINGKFKIFTAWINFFQVDRQTHLSLETSWRTLKVEWNSIRVSKRKVGRKSTFWCTTEVLTNQHSQHFEIFSYVSVQYAWSGKRVLIFSLTRGVSSKYY